MRVLSYRCGSGKFTFSRLARTLDTGKDNTLFAPLHSCENICGCMYPCHSNAFVAVLLSVTYLLRLLAGMIFASKLLSLVSISICPV